MNTSWNKENIYYATQKYQDKDSKFFIQGLKINENLPLMVQILRFMNFHDMKNILFS